MRTLSIPALWQALPDPGLPLFQWSGEWPGSTHEQQCQQPCQLGEYPSASPSHQLQGLWWRLSLLTTGLCRASAKYASETKQRKGLKNNTCKACVSSVWTPSAWRALCKNHTCKANQSSEWIKAYNKRPCFVVYACVFSVHLIALLFLGNFCTRAFRNCIYLKICLPSNQNSVCQASPAAPFSCVPSVTPLCYLGPFFVPTVRPRPSWHCDLWVQVSLGNGSRRILNFTAAGLFCGLCWVVLVG